MTKEFLRRHGGYLVLLAIMLVGSASLGWARLTVWTQVAAAEELARPADIRLTVITPSDCSDCFDASIVTNHLATGPVNVVVEDSVEQGSDEAGALIERYSITRIPAVIITGEIDKANAASFLEGSVRPVADGAVWADMPPVYVSVASGAAQGRVTLTIVGDESCDECYDPSLHKAILENNFTMVVSDVQTVDISDAKGRDLVSHYNITKVPTVLISSDAMVYREFVSAFPGVGDVADDGIFVFRDITIFGKPYKDLSTGKVVDPAVKDDNLE